MIALGYAMSLCGGLLAGSSPRQGCFLTTASPICLRMLMGWQVVQHIIILQQLLKHILPSNTAGILTGAVLLDMEVPYMDLREKLKWNLVGKMRVGLFNTVAELFFPITSLVCPVVQEGAD